MVVSRCAGEGFEEILNMVLLNADSRVSHLDGQDALKLEAKRGIHRLLPGRAMRRGSLPRTVNFHDARGLAQGWEDFTLLCFFL